ncbi:MAG: ribose 5-phosphate isomerase B [Candidatus Margulisbacteria bacterium]|nr:ribose 5-phosphate isomerase B [Candidatus Margulisiibacteriota bacterium]
MRIAIGSDHGGIDLKSHIISHLSETQPHTQIQDVGTHNPDSVDYPDYAEKVTQAITQKEADLGILVCGTGIGMSIKANRTNGIRAALVFSDFTAEMAKAHNNANILCLGGRTTDPQDAKKFIDIWLNTPFEGDRHARRVEKLG